MCSFKPKKEKKIRTIGETIIKCVCGGHCACLPSLADIVLIVLRSKVDDAVLLHLFHVTQMCTLTLRRGWHPSLARRRLFCTPTDLQLYPVLSPPIPRKETSYFGLFQSLCVCVRAHVCACVCV